MPFERSARLQHRDAGLIGINRGPVITIRIPCWSVVLPLTLS